MNIQSSTKDLSSAELIIALTSAVGTDTNLITDEIEKHLKLFNYKVFVIKISQEILEPLTATEKLQNSTERANALMDTGNKIRRDTDSNFILACAVAQKIQEKRIQEQKNFSNPSQSDKNFFNLPKLENTAFIITSLKHPEEVIKFREIYGNNFFLFAINENEESRINNLNQRNIGNADAKALILRDADENDKYGQHTRGVFEMADFHLTLNRRKNQNNALSKIQEKKQIIQPQIERILDLIFGNPHITPTFDEYAMFLAYSSGLRSADLSRQVGAVISNKKNEIISTGANDVPQYGGGQYWPDQITYKEKENGRDYIRGYDANKREHQNLIKEIVDSYTYKDEQEKQEFSQRLMNSRIKYLTEFGRAVHAEMAAIIACSRTGISLDGATLYCSTFPCHNCAKHIINAGITRVVYIEPYPKSKTLELYDDSTTINGEDDKVHFEEFVGIGPRQFFNLFSLKLSNGRSIIRKDKNGCSVNWERKNARTRLQTMPISYIEKEGFESLKWRNTDENT